VLKAFKQKARPNSDSTMNLNCFKVQLFRLKKVRHQKNLKKYAKKAKWRQIACFFRLKKKSKNISGYLSNGKKSRSLDENPEIISSNHLYNNNLNSDDSDYNLTISSSNSKNRFPKCSTSSSIDSTNSSSSMDSNNPCSNKKALKSSNNIGNSVFHKISSGSSQLSSGYSTLQSKTNLDSIERQFDNNLDEFNLGPSEKLHVKPTDFEFLKLIGKGSYGSVMLARHKKEQKVYAVKVLQKKMIIKRNEENHIMCERNVLLKNLNHPFLVNLHYAFQTSSKLYFILEYINGGELYFHLQKENRFDENRARFYAAEITSALGYLHRRNIIYRDLKPENLLLDSEGHIVLTDFGLCKDNLTQDDTTTTFCGSLDYLSPEILRKEAYGWQVDWWCLGAVFYEMLHGIPPFYSHNGDQRQMFHDILYKQVKLSTNTSIAARSIIVGLLQKNKENRLGSLNDAEEIKSHEFFRSINWADLESKKIKPPFNPNVKNAMDIRNISTEFTREPIPQSLCRSSSMGSSSIPEHAFQGFSYAASSAYLS